MMPMREFKYNRDYYQKIKHNCEKYAKEINSARWDFVKEIDISIALDYGCANRNLEKYAPPGIIVDSYDIGTIDGKPFPQTGIVHDKYDIVFFNDVLEHIPDFCVLDDVLARTQYVAVAIPLYSGSFFSYDELSRWRHYKYLTGEHLHYFTERSLILFFLARGFSVVKMGRPEEFIRTDIRNFLFKKVRDLSGK